MKTLDRLVDRLLLEVVNHASEKTIVIGAVAIYAGFGLALPLIFDWSVSWLIAANVMATTVAAVLVLVWLAVQVQASHRRHLVEWTTNLRLLDSAEFEWLVGELFRREGWQVEELGRRDGPDGNVDLRLTRSGLRRLVQCKRWTAWLVGVEEVRGFAGTLMREGLAGGAGIFVTLSDFTEQARAEAASIGLELLDNRDLYARVEKARRPEACPRCGASMLLDRSGRGWWFRCVAAGCTGKRDLGTDPARAIELLTESQVNVTDTARVG